MTMPPTWGVSPSPMSTSIVIRADNSTDDSHEHDVENGPVKAIDAPIRHPADKSHSPCETEGEKPVDVSDIADHTAHPLVD